MKRKRTLFCFSRGDFKAVEGYLNEQARKGWELEKVGLLARWKRTDRRDLTWCVDLAKPNQDRELRQDYTEFCAEGGWELMDFYGRMYIFKSMPGRQAVPVQTDPELEKKNYNRYYIRNTILSVVVLALYVAFWLALGAALGGSGRRGTGPSWLGSWTQAALVLALPGWGLWALWKVADFIRAMVQSRKGAIGDSPRWVMWTNCVVSVLAGAAAALCLLCLSLETVLSAGLASYMLILSALWGVVCLYRALTIDRELFRGERRRSVKAGVALLAVFAVLVVGRIAAPYDTWSTSYYGGNEEEGLAVYEQTFALPLVHGEDLGIPFDPEEGENVYITHEVIPAGRYWELEYLYRDSRGLLELGSKTVFAPTRALARQIAADYAAGADLGRFAVWPEEGLTPISVDWADEAWYGRVEYEDGYLISVLVLCADKQAVRLIFPCDLAAPELLAVIGRELGAI